MDAPIYLPAAAFEQLIEPPYVLKLENVSLAELMQIPAARDIVLNHLPSLQRMIGSPMLQPHLGNMTVQSLASFGRAVPPEVVAAIDQELGRLPAVQESAR